MGQNRIKKMTNRKFYERRKKNIVGERNKN